jgi:hypothetical protein
VPYPAHPPGEDEPDPDAATQVCACAGRVHMRLSLWPAPALVVWELGPGTGEKDGCLAREGRPQWACRCPSPPPSNGSAAGLRRRPPACHPPLLSSRAPTPAGQPPCLSSEAGEVMQQRNRKWRTRRIGKERKEQEPSPFDVGLGIRSIRVIRFGLFGFVKFRVLKNENRNFQKYFRNRTRIDSQFRFGLFGPPNRPEL